MITANITFGPRGKSTEDALEDVAESYLASLLHAGQIYGKYFLTWTGGCLNSHVLLAGRGAAAFRHHSRGGKEALRKIIETFGREPVWRMLDDDENQPASTWRGARFLYLLTHALDHGSPVCRGDGKPAVPVFLLPVTFETKERLYAWKRSYYHHDHVWLASGTLEHSAYRQLADPKSQLSAEGRDLCREIETATGVPAYYYLKRHWSRPTGEDRRTCPGCNRAWRIEHPPEPPRRFWQFDFQCDPCRLVSHSGVWTGGKRQTRVGEFHTKE